MKKRIGMILTLVLCVLCICSVNLENSYAANKLTNKQKQIYRKIVAQYVEDAEKNGGGSNTITFSVEDINNDGVKELVVQDCTDAASACWFSSIYDKNGKCIKVSTYKGSYASAAKAFDHAYGLLGIEKYKNGIIMCIERYSTGTGETYYQVQKNGTFREIAHSDCSHFDQEGNQIEYYSVKGKKVNWSTFDAKVKSFGTGKSLKGYNATKKNINKMFGQVAEWKTAYQNFFDKKTISWGTDHKVSLGDLRFAFVDIDQNGVPELILENKDSAMAYGFEHVYGYSNGKIVKMLDDSYGNVITYNKKNRMICSSGGNMDLFYEDYYVIKENRAVCIASREIKEEYDYDKGGFNTKIAYYDKHSFDSNVKKISKKQFESKVKEGWNLDGEKKYKKGFEFKEVTRNNLSKYLN